MFSSHSRKTLPGRMWTASHDTLEVGVIVFVRLFTPVQRNYFEWLPCIRVATAFHPPTPDRACFQNAVFTQRRSWSILEKFDLGSRYFLETFHSQWCGVMFERRPKTKCFLFSHENVNGVFVGSRCDNICFFLCDEKAGCIQLPQSQLGSTHAYSNIQYLYQFKSPAEPSQRRSC